MSRCVIFTLIFFAAKALFGAYENYSDGSYMEFVKMNGMRHWTYRVN